MTKSELLDEITKDQVENLPQMREIVKERIAEGISKREMSEQLIIECVRCIADQHHCSIEEAKERMQKITKNALDFNRTILLDDFDEYYVTMINCDLAVFENLYDEEVANM